MPPFFIPGFQAEVFLRFFETFGPNQCYEQDNKMDGL